jgi:hypothetical protein
MKTLALILFLLPSVMLAQEGNPLGILGVEVYGNSAILKDDSAWRNCGANYEMIIYQLEGDTLGWYQKGNGLVNCDCLFNLSVTLDSLNPGNYSVKVSFEDSYSPDTVYIGLISFTILEQNSFTGFVKTDEYQSPCGIVGMKKQDQVFNSPTIIPNPANNKILIHCPRLSEKAFFRFFNSCGSGILEGEIESSESELDISALPQGVYFVRVQDENQVQITKLIKQ